MTLSQVREIIDAESNDRAIDFIPTFDALRTHGAIVEYFGMSALDWVIVGGESGAGARPMEDAWAESIVQQCAAAGTAVFVKQMGGPVKARMRTIPQHLQVRQFPVARRNIDAEG